MPKDSKISYYYGYSININTHLIYDDKVKIGKDSNDDGVITENEIKPRIQFKELLGIGVSFKF